MVCVQYLGNLEFPRICIFVISLYVLLLVFLQYFVEALAEANSTSYAREAPRLAKLEIAPSLPPTGGESTPPDPPHPVTPPPPPPRPPNRRPPPPSPAPLPYAFYYYPPSKPSYNSTVIIALPILAFILIFICSFIWSHNQRVNANQAAMAGGDTGTSSDTAAPPPAAQMQAGGQGLNSALVNKLPTLVFTEQKSRGLKKGRKEYLYSCAVCISDFEEGETLKLLPACGHAFHKDCIDMWLFSHSTCPLCRLGLVNNKGELLLPEEDDASDSQRGAHVAVDLGERVSRPLDRQVLSPLIKMFRRTQSSIDRSQADLARTRGSFPLQRSCSQPLRTSSKIHPSHSFS